MASDEHEPRDDPEAIDGSDAETSAGRDPEAVGDPGGAYESTEDPERSHDQDEADEQDQEAAPVAASSRARNLTLLGIGTIAVLGLVAFVLSRSEEPPAAPTTTTTTTTSTTTTVPVRPALVSQVATVKPNLQRVFIQETPPEGWEAMTPAIVWEAPELPASQAEFDRPALPREDYKIQGRYKVDGGWEFLNPGPFDGPTAFLVTEQRGNWAEVMMPVRPNGTKGYLDVNQVDMSEHDYRVELDISDRRLVAYKGTEVIADTRVVVGRDSTRTPLGRFYVTDKTQDTPSSFYGPAMLPLNSYSEQLDTFDDGVPVIAMHGTTRPDLLGQAESNGCVRMPNEIVSLLYDQLPIGTQVEIYA
jgi:hypothetical protein